LNTRNIINEKYIEKMEKNPFSKYTKIAKETHKKWDEHRENSHSNSRTCENCGAARPKDTNLSTCGYCGFKFMDTDIQIHIK